MSEEWCLQYKEKEYKSQEMIILETIKVEDLIIKEEDLLWEVKEEIGLNFFIILIQLKKNNNVLQIIFKNFKIDRELSEDEKNK